MKRKTWLLLAAIGFVLSGFVTSLMLYFGWLTEPQAIKLIAMGTLAIPISERFFPIATKK